MDHKKKYMLSDILDGYIINRTIYDNGIIKYKASYDGNDLAEFSTSLHNYENLTAMDEMAKYALYKDIKRLFKINEGEQ